MQWLTDELKDVQKEALQTNGTIKNIEKTVNKLNGTTLKISQIVERREILKTELLGNVQKVAGMGVALGGVAFGIDRINQSTVQMANLADTVGLSFNTVNALGGAVKGIGLNYEHVTDIMEELNNKIEEFIKYIEVEFTTENSFSYDNDKKYFLREKSSVHLLPPNCCHNNALRRALSSNARILLTVDGLFKIPGSPLTII